MVNINRKPVLDKYQLSTMLTEGACVDYTPRFVFMAKNKLYDCVCGEKLNFEEVIDGNFFNHVAMCEKCGKVFKVSITRCHITMAQYNDNENKEVKQ